MTTSPSHRFTASLFTSESLDLDTTLPYSFSSSSETLFLDMASSESSGSATPPTSDTCEGVEQNGAPLFRSFLQLIQQQSLPINSSEVDEAMASLTAETVEDRFRCCWQNCQLVFATEILLDAHVVHLHIADGKAPFVCEWKDCRRNRQPFMKRGKMCNHMRTHTDARPYICEQHGCGKAFSRHDALQAHYRLHEAKQRDRGYPCPMQNCNKKYYNPKALRAHLKSHGMVEMTSKSELKEARKSEKKRSQRFGLLTPPQCAQEFQGEKLVLVERMGTPEEKMMDDTHSTLVGGLGCAGRERKKRGASASIKAESRAAWHPYSVGELRGVPWAMVLHAVRVLCIYKEQRGQSYEEQQREHQEGNDVHAKASEEGDIETFLRTEVCDEMEDEVYLA